MRTSLRLTAAAACLAGVAATAPTAMAATRFSVQFNQSPRGGTVFVDDNATRGGHTVQTNLLRGGSVIATDNESFGFGGVGVPNRGALAAGDQVQMLVDGAQVLLRTYDGNPTINGDACVGATKFTGAVSDAGNFSVEVFRRTTAGGGSGFSQDRKAINVSRSGGSYTGTLREALAADDIIDSEQDFVDGDTFVTQFTSKNPAATCPPPAQPAATPPTPTTTGTPSTTPAKPSIAQIFAALQAVVAQAGTEFNGLDLTSFLKSGSTNIPLTFLVPGKFRALLIFTTGGSSRSAEIAKKKAKKAKAITVASGTATRATPGKASMKVKLSKAGKKLLRHRSTAHLSLQMVFTPADGTPAQKTATKITLKKHPKKKTKKTKKAGKRG